LERIAVPAAQDAWRSQAACRGKPASWWFPKEGQWSDADAVKARAICARCPVKDPCGHHALTANEYGIWGHRSQRERVIEVRAARRAERETKLAKPAPSPKPKPGRPFSPTAQAVLGVLADGRWHDIDEIFGRVASTICEDRARRRQAGHLRSEGRIVDPADIGQGGTRAGQRLVLQSTLGDLAKRAVIERVRGAVRLDVSFPDKFASTKMPENNEGPTCVNSVGPSGENPQAIGGPVE
jgi:WhiB family redox-sensing transcriptional regulator